MKHRIRFISTLGAILLVTAFTAGYLTQCRSQAPKAGEEIPAMEILPAPGAGQVPAEPWILPVPQDIPAGEQQLAVTYRQVRQTVYSACPLYVRSGPGTEYPVIGSLRQGDPVTRGAVGDNGWSQILFEGSEAYVNTMNLSVTPVAPDPGLPAGVSLRAAEDLVRAIDTTKIRTGPGTEFPVIGHMTRGSGARRTGICSNGWSQVYFHDTLGYTSTAYLTGPDTPADPVYTPAPARVYASQGVNIRSGPGTGFPVLGKAREGQPLDRISLGEDGWTKIAYGDQDAYVCTAFLSDNPLGTAATVVSLPRERPTENSPFYFAYSAPEGILPHGIFTPVDWDGVTPLPLFISLHGALEIGESPETLMSNFLTREFRNWEYTGLAPLDAILVCPQLTGCGLSNTWSCPETADQLFALIDHLQSLYAIDPDRISLEGHSLGAQGALYMALDPRAEFSALVLVSAYHPGIPVGPVDCPVRGYNGSPFIPAPREDWDSYNFMKKIFTELYGPENWFTKSCSHYAIPMVALEEDADGDGRSDLMDWVLSQSR